MLEDLRDKPNRTETPSIYHLDVGAMYPNIILTNRLQPDSIVDDAACASCDFNQGPESTCQRRMTWSWRGEYFLSTRGEYNMLKNQLEQEKFPALSPMGAQRAYHELSNTEQESYLKKRMSDYTRKVYGKTFNQKVVEKTSIVCQRENPFYVNTVRNFRDRRYEYKALLKQWKSKLEYAHSSADANLIDECSKMVVLYDSLQTAHKCILNSFYGYVMRKGARWYSMEMAGIVCLTGAKIIQLARVRVEQIGRPLELDTDGIWCMLPASFPENFTLKLINGKSYNISYPCVMLNHLVHDQFTNDQYQDLSNPETREYSTRSENSIFFEVDGPYRAMILPASTEADKLLKKRYAVFNHDGTLAELKGFEVKRRGELKMIKNFQSSIFKIFLEGNTLYECYHSVAKVCNRWVDILDSKGRDLNDNELFDLVSENRSMSKALEEYGAQKSTSITCAKRLAELLGAHMVQDKGLNCKFIISEKPFEAPVSERAIPLALFQSESNIKRHYLRKWTKDQSLEDEDIRNLLDWNYYTERFGSVIQKLVTIPAAFQEVENPVPRIPHPEWLLKRLSVSNSKQKKITDMFSIKDKEKIRDLEEVVEISSKSNVENLPAKNRTINLSIQITLPVNHPERSSGGKRRIGNPLKLPRGWKKNKSRIKQKQTDELNPYNLQKQYISWLQFQKNIWRVNIKKRARKIEGVPKHFAITQPTGVLELLQIAETDSLGIFRLWALINGKLDSIELDVPRIFYLNSRVPDPNENNSRTGIKMTKKNRILPRGHPCLNLYELQMSEYFFKANASSFSAMFNHKDIEGVYETNVPLIFRALIHLGTFVQLGIPLTDYDRNRPLELQNLIRAESAEPYLPKGRFESVYIYHAYAARNHLIGIFHPNAKKITCFINSPFNDEDSTGNLKRLYSDQFKEFKENSYNAEQFFEYSESVECRTQMFKTEQNMLSALNDFLLSLKSIGSGPTVLMIQSSYTSKFYRNSGVSAFREFPVLNIPHHKADNQLPALGWQRYSVIRMMSHIFNLSEFLLERINLAKYANVPVCNIESDFTIFLSDLFMSRKLKASDHVLWCSPASKPDLGGSEQDENLSFLDEFKCPELNTPGTFDKICIELDLWDLSLNTLLRSGENSGDLDIVAQINARGNAHLLDDHFIKVKDQKTPVIKRTKLTDVESPHHALIMMRKMVKGWVSEVRLGNKYASNLLEHLHRWISSHSSLLYDGLIVSYTLNLMKRSFALLLDELIRLGSKVIYANFEKIVISTTKTDLKTGVGYIQYVLASISKNTNFEHVELKPAAIWNYLVWYDTFNYGGLIYREGFENLEDLPMVDMRWNIAEYLPKQVENMFLKVVAEYLYVVQSLGDHEIGQFISTELKRKLMSCIEDIRHKRIDNDIKENSESHYSFPSLPGSTSKMKNPALEFIKMITMVFALDCRYESEERLLKRDLLRLIDVREFSEDARFSNPCEKYVLNQVICEYCNYCCDLDLTRKHAIENQFLACDGCGMIYDKDDIEMKLIKDAEALHCRWHLQDLRCVKCRFLANVLLLERCKSCSNPLETILRKEIFVAKLQVMLNIANYFRMENLKEYAQFLKS
jgi:DNA polymerase epsilon subunit 1